MSIHPDKDLAARRSNGHKKQTPHLKAEQKRRLRPETKAVSDHDQALIFPLANFAEAGISTAPYIRMDYN